jgi:hypothetical protein
MASSCQGSQVVVEAAADSLSYSHGTFVALAMRAFHGPSDELWPDRYEIDLDELRSSGNHDDFMTHAVELFKEVGIVTALVASTATEDIRTHDRNEAIQRGLIVRLAKLANSLLK